MNKEFWLGKRVFLTGHTGFKGGWMALWLSRLGATVTGYALPPSTDPSFFQLCDVQSSLNSLIGDIRDLETLKKTVLNAKPEVVLHMAAQPLVRASYQAPLDTFSSNVIGTANLLEACRSVSSIRSIVVVTTDKCYENNEWHWGYRESDPLGGHDPYSASKACAEIVTSAYRRSFFHEDNSARIASARAGNVIGGGDWSDDRLLPDILREFARGRSVNIRNPAAVRPWQHVLEPLAAYLLLAEKLSADDGEKFIGAWNFGPHEKDCVSVGDLVESMKRLLGGDVSFNIDKKNQPHEATFLKLDCSRARDLLGWQPVWSLQETLVTISEWQRHFLIGENLFDLAIATIEAYEQDLIVQEGGA